MHKKDLPLLIDIQDYFEGVGNIVEDKKKDSVEFRVSSLKDLSTNIFPHLDKYCLKTQKYGDYLLLKKIIEKKNQKNFDIQEIVNIRATLNKGLSEKLKAAFPNTKEVERPLVENKVIPHPEWFAGFTSAEGCFLIEVDQSSSYKYKLGLNVRLRFQVTQHNRDEQFLKSFISYLKCGRHEIKVKGDDGFGNFCVTKFSDIYEKIIPFFNKHSIKGVKYKDYIDWCKAAKIMSTKSHLTKEGSEEIIKIKEGMNKRRSS